MFSGLRKLFGAVSAKEENGVITVEGVDTYVMLRDISTLWATSRINNNMFLKIGASSFSFYSYFATDILYTLERLTDHNSLKVSVRTLNKIKNELLENTWLSNTIKPSLKTLDYTRLANLTYTPKDFQQGFFEEYDRITQQYQLNGMLFAGTAGSGKTFTSLALAEMRDAPLVYIVCPLNAVEKVWKENIETVFKRRQTYRLSTQDGFTRQRARFMVCHYEALPKLLEFAKTQDNRNAVVILDESHNLNELGALRTERFIELCGIVKSKDVIWLSGTPIKALAVESIPLFKSIDPLFTDEVMQRFKKIYSGSQGRSLEILNYRLGLMTYKVEKKSLGLADPIIGQMPVKMPNSDKYTLPAIKITMQNFIEERRAYYERRRKADEEFFYETLDQYEKMLHPNELPAYKQYRTDLKIVIRMQGDFSAKDEMARCNRYEKTQILPKLPSQELKNKFKETKSIVKYVHLKIQGECLGRVVGGLRKDCHVDMVKYIDFKAICESTKKKTIVFTSFVEAVELGAKVVAAKGLEPAVVYAKTSHMLASIMDRYEKDPNCNPLFATYKSLSTAVPVIMADTMVLIDAPFRDYQLQQTISRIHRLGQDSQTYVWTTYLDTGSVPNISTRSYDILKWSQEQVEAIMGIKSPFELSDDLTALDAALECAANDVNVSTAVPAVESGGMNEEDKETFSDILEDMFTAMEAYEPVKKVAFDNAPPSMAW